MAGERYITNAPAYLRLKAAGPTSDPIYVPADVEVGEGTPYDFEGSPTPFMTPVNDAAKATHAAYLEEIGSGIPQTVKGGAAKPFDPADPNSDSQAEKAASSSKEDELKKREEELDKREVAARQSFEESVKSKQAELSRTADDLDAKTKALAKREAELAAREKALAEADSKKTEGAGKTGSSSTATQNK